MWILEDRCLLQSPRFRLTGDHDQTRVLVRHDLALQRHRTEPVGLGIIDRRVGLGVLGEQLVDTQFRRVIPQLLRRLLGHELRQHPKAVIVAELDVNHRQPTPRPLSPRTRTLHPKEMLVDRGGTEQIALRGQELRLDLQPFGIIGTEVQVLIQMPQGKIVIPLAPLRILLLRTRFPERLDLIQSATQDPVLLVPPEEVQAQRRSQTGRG